MSFEFFKSKPKTEKSPEQSKLDKEQKAALGLAALGGAVPTWRALGPDFSTVLRTAAKVGVKHYFIEDESPTVEQQLPVSLKYLQSLK